ncbi:MAG: type II secretion system secretin GspD [Candidatus Tectomicrobia bacterium]|nr:type II secretion system secretin GspD [Candidatus Tectomicrobia bacterium]
MACCVVVGTVSAASAQIRLNLGDVEINAFIQVISRITGKTFIADEKVKGRVNVFSPGEVTVDEAYQIFLDVLEVMGYSTLPSTKGIVKIVPSEEASRRNPQTLPDRLPARREANFQARVIPVRHLKVEDIEPMVNAMISPVGQLIVFRRNNSLVVTDYKTNIARISEVLEMFDQPGLGDRVEVVPLQFSPADAIASVLRSLRPDVVAPSIPVMAAQPPTVRGAVRPRPALLPSVVVDKAPVRIVADDRINAIVLMGPQAQIEGLKGLIAALDVPSTSLRKNIYVHPVKNASAEDLLPVLRELISGQAATEAKRDARPPPPGQRAEPARRPEQRTARQQKEEEETAPTFLGDVTIVADKGTNAFLITATQRDYEALKPVIELLDIQRRQVRIEAIIAEISESKALQLGFDLQVAKNVDGGLLIGRTSTSSSLPAFVAQGSGATAVPTGSISSFFSLSGLAALAVSGANVLTPDGQSIPAQALLFRALETDSDIEVLSRPSIVTRDHQEAEIVVGSNVPFIVATQTSRADPNAVTNQIERRDIGVILRITPQITEGDNIRLDLFQEISSIQDSPPAFDVNTQGLVLRKRSARTSIVVKDRQLLAIGGLVSDDISRSRTGVPLLSKIPILGALFRFDNNRGEKTNLLILLTPRVAREPEEPVTANAGSQHEIISPPISPVTEFKVHRERNKVPRERD